MTVRVMAEKQVFSPLEIDRLAALMRFYARLGWTGGFELVPRLLVITDVPGHAVGMVLDDLRGIITTRSVLDLTQVRLLPNMASQQLSPGFV